MKNVKHGIALLGVVVALVAAAFGGDFTVSQDGSVTQGDTYQVTKDGDYLIGATGLHW